MLNSPILQTPRIIPYLSPKVNQTAIKNYLCAAVSVNALESANIVGYTNYETDQLRQPSFGACFIPVNGSDTYKLGDLKPTDFNVDDDLIQIINPTTLGTDARYVYMSKEIADAAAIEEGGEAGDYDALIGWWDPVIGVGEDGASCMNVSVEAGAAFLGLFESGNDITFNFPSSTAAVPTFE